MLAFVSGEQRRLLAAAAFIAAFALNALTGGWGPWPRFVRALLAAAAGLGLVLAARSFRRQKSWLGAGLGLGCALLLGAAVWRF